MTASTSPDPTPRIVVAEDDVQLRTLIVEVLADAGFAILEADDAEEALRLLGEQAGGIQVLFTDVNMPGPMNGLELARLARLKWPWLRVMIGSGAAPDPLPAEGRFLPKPYRIGDLPARMRELMTRVSALSGPLLACGCLKTLPRRRTLDGDLSGAAPCRVRPDLVGQGC